MRVSARIKGVVLIRIQD